MKKVTFVGNGTFLQTAKIVWFFASRREATEASFRKSLLHHIFALVALVALVSSSIQTFFL
jgi:hypothetical protein